MKSFGLLILTFSTLCLLLKQCVAYNGLSCTCSQCSSCPQVINECGFRDGAAGTCDDSLKILACDNLPCLSQFESTVDACKDFCNYAGCSASVPSGDSCPTCTGSCPSCTSGSCLYYGSTEVFCCDGEVGCCQEGLHAYCGQCGSVLKDNSCFHEDSLITYKQHVYSLVELQEGREPECVVPHTVVSAGGLIIYTSCGISHTARVTSSHLMATPIGFFPAKDLKIGDFLYTSDATEKQTVCVVTAIENEVSVQNYFGLNCLHSEVLVNGLGASTFGDYHTIPATYMRYFGNFLGVAVASRIGEYIVQLFYFVKW